MELTTSIPESWLILELSFGFLGSFSFFLLLCNLIQIVERFGFTATNVVLVQLSIEHGNIAVIRRRLTERLQRRTGRLCPGQSSVAEPLSLNSSTPGTKVYRALHIRHFFH